MSDAAAIHRLLDETVRRERGWLISSLVSRLGPAQVDLAQDVAQDAIVKALATWPYKGIPDNPRAWLRRVAGNAAIDRVRRSARELGLDESWDFTAPEEDVITPSLSDPELDLMVLCCDPELAPQDQLILALKTVSGFTAAETSALLFLMEDTLSQRLARAKRRLREQTGELARFPTRFALKQRLPLLLRIIYLMFAWGYLPRRGKDLVREDLCREAIRLSEGLMARAPETTPGHHALHALLLFQTARLPARFGPDGTLITLEEQDRSFWDDAMIEDGFAQLGAAQNSPDLTRYHFEAGIAAIHARAPSFTATDWASIAKLYELLDKHASSPAIKVNWAVSLIMLGDLDRAETLLSALAPAKALQSFTGYHLARHKLADARGDAKAAKATLAEARACMNSQSVADHIDQQWRLFGDPD
ncbi:MAG: sigma-70 family RNA polymerase sigma factor [Henriciella sp.]|nr:sigma-70 family RNA polymerase sigma factor [Henriciella sp.]